MRKRKEVERKVQVLAFWKKHVKDMTAFKDVFYPNGDGSAVMNIGINDLAFYLPIFGLDDETMMAMADDPAGPPDDEEQLHFNFEMAMVPAKMDPADVGWVTAIYMSGSTEKFAMIDVGHNNAIDDARMSIGQTAGALSV